VRHLPGRPLPPYAFLPGRDPHPTRDPEGHSFGRREPAATRVAPERWRENEPYLWGVDLYNHGFLWEAHEAWESLWHASKPERVQALFVQALIQCAAAWLKIPMEQPRGVERLSTLALEKLTEVRAAVGPSYMGLELDDWCAAVREFAAQEAPEASAYPRIELA
jgi:hypothetical protein